MRVRLIQPGGAVGRIFPKMRQRIVGRHRFRSRRSWQELTPLPPILGLASANCAAQCIGIHVEAVMPLVRLQAHRWGR
jgi:hypothetical protein